MAKKNLPTLFPNLELTKTKITALVKKASDDELHATYAKMTEFANVFSDITKKEFIDRIKKFRKKFPNENFVTALGKIVLASRSKFSFKDKNKGEDKLHKIMKKNNIDESRIYDIGYTVVTNNQKALNVLLERGLIVKVRKINWNKVEDTSLQYPEILELIENNPTEYLRGL